MSKLFEDIVGGLEKEAGEKDGPEYKAYFQKKLSEAGYATVANIPEAKKKAFFDSVDKGWKSDDEEKVDAKKDNKFIKKAEQLIGGKADGKANTAFDPKQLAEGIEAELDEHTNSFDKAKEIAKDHLTELPDYYERLEEMEEEGKEELGIKEED